MELKRDFVELACREGANMRQLCGRFGISPPTGYKWLARHRAGEGLEELSRKPSSSPGKTKAQIEALVVAARQQHPVWGGRKLKRWLENRGVKDVPSISTITEILRRHGLLQPPAGPSGKGWQRFERAAPNELWQMDYKGWFELARGGRCYPLTMLDDHSRFNLLLEPCAGETFAELRPLLESAFRTYGLPQAILCDNGKPWGDSSGHFTQCEAWLLRLGVAVYHGRPRHPQTQGKDERFHRTFGAEVLSRTMVWQDHGHCRREFVKWREIYNHERPHDSLDDAVPASRHEISARQLPAKLQEAGEWYGGNDVVRKVLNKGIICFHSVLWSIGEAFKGQDVALRRVGEERFEVYYCWKRIGVADFARYRASGEKGYAPLEDRRVGRPPQA
ncbi:IS481 family transposase [Haloferula sp. BvORR071]|uniref:IS481 family transposase n=1 Tax=Haloferula sp. BvORR071 TaxID=1396141 RepID=UPI000697741D|nr:IS481 family transposase [Haloferula sp. BvORR071]